MNTAANPNPIDLRDLIVGEANGFVLTCTIRDLVARGWPTEAILAELPTVSEADIRRAREANDRAA